MSRILKRPMFRRGGPAMEGVMKLASGGRAKYQDAGRVTMQDLIKDDPFLKEIYQTAQAGYGRDIQQERSDVLANLLIRGGLGLVSGEGAGKGTLGAIATAFRGPTEQALAEMAKLKQDPAAMLTAKTAIEQKGAERLARIQNENKLLDAQKKAQIIVGPQKSGESQSDYAARVNAEAKKIIEESTYGVGERFKEGIKQDDIEIIQKQYLLEKPEAEKYYNFQKKKDAIENKTGKPVQGYIDGTRTKGGKIDYSRKAKNKPDGIYYDPQYDVYLQIENGVATTIADPLGAATSGQVSTVPKVEEKKIVTKQPGAEFFESRGNNPFLNIG
jgi:hypothetical protein